jgi:LysM repeat protein
VNGSVFQKQTEQVLTDAAVLEEQTQPPAELVLSFVKEGESLWQIAKRYRTTVASIREENDLSEDTLPEDRMLLIVAV